MFVLTDTVALLGHLSYLLLIAASMFRDMLALRAVAVASGVCGLLYAAFWPSSPRWIDIGWESGFIAVNIAQILLLLGEKKGASGAGAAV